MLTNCLTTAPECRKHPWTTTDTRTLADQARIVVRPASGLLRVEEVMVPRERRAPRLLALSPAGDLRPVSAARGRPHRFALGLNSCVAG